jgi:hypothetical protein
MVAWLALAASITDLKGRIRELLCIPRHILSAPSCPCCSRQHKQDAAEGERNPGRSQDPNPGPTNVISELKRNEEDGEESEKSNTSSACS